MNVEALLLFTRFLTLLHHSRVYSVSCKDQHSSLMAGSSWCWLSLIPEGCGLALLHFFTEYPCQYQKGIWKMCSGSPREIVYPWHVDALPWICLGQEEPCSVKLALLKVQINRCTLTECWLSSQDCVGSCGECIIFKTPSLPQRVVWSRYRGQAALKLFTASVYPVAAGTMLGDDYPKLRIES